MTESRIKWTRISRGCGNRKREKKIEESDAGQLEIKRLLKAEDPMRPKENAKRVS